MIGSIQTGALGLTQRLNVLCKAKLLIALKLISIILVQVLRQAVGGTGLELKITVRI